MKKIIKFIFVFILLIPIIINAASFSTERGNVNNLLSKENYVNTKDKYILYGSNVKYNYQDRTNKQISNFINGGFLSIEEYRLTIVRNNSYLFDGVEYWTLTSNSGKYYVIAYDDSNSLQPDSANYRGRATEFVKSNVSVTGTGKRNDPWTFDPMYKVGVKVEHGSIIEGNNTFVKGNCNKTECTAQIKLAADDGYRYITNSCNGTYDATTQIFKVSNVKRDTVCNVIFGLGKYKLTLTGATPSYVYLKFEENFYTETDMQTIIRKLTGVPSRAGYRFKGYKCNQEGICNNVMVVDENKNLLTSALNKINGDVTIEPYMEPIQYTVTLDQQGATTNGTTSVTAEYNAAMSGIVLPQKTGYTFGGYFTSTNGGGTQYYNADGTSTRNYNLTTNTTLYAKWTVNTYTITYNNNSGSGCTTKSVTYGSTYGTLCTPTRSGYTFGGWYKESALTNQITASSTVNTASNHNLYAKWTANTYTVTYNNNSGSGCTNKTVTFASTYGTLCSPTRTGYTFAGWYKETGLTNQVTASTTVNTASNHGLYAKWTVNTYTVTYNNNNGSGCNTKSVTYASTYGTLCTPTRSGYTFGGWYKESSLTTQVTSSTTVNTASNHNLYAKWTANTYTVTYNNNNGSGCDTKSVTYGSTYGTLCTPTRTGYTFGGWYKESSLTTQVTSSSTVSTASNHNLYAKWTANTYTVTYNNNSGSGCDTKSVTYASTYGTLCTPTRTGYTFGGWYKESSLTTQVTSSTTVNTASNHNLYAKWTANTYTVKYNANGGSGTMSNSTHTYGTAKALTTNAFTRSGYTFSGWAKASDGSVEYSDGQSVSNITSTANATVNLYAVWTINKVFVKYHMNGGSWAGSTSTHLGVSGSFVTYDGVIGANNFAVDYDGTMNLANWNNSSYINISKTGYSAKANAQWCTNTDGTGNCYNQDTDYTNVGTDATASTHFCDARSASCTVTLYVNWVPNTYTVTYENNGGSGCSTKSVTYNSTYGTLCTPTKSGYDFAGWYKESGLTNQVTASSTVSTTSNHTLYAKWTAHKIYLRYHVNGGTWAGSTNTHLGVSSSYVTYDGNSTTVFNVNYGDTINLANYNNSSYINISKTGYSGKSGAQWCTAANGTGNCYNQDTDYTGGGTDATAAHFCDARSASCTVTLYVNWVPSTYTVTYENNGGSGCSTKSVTYNSTYGTLCTPTRSGYTFKGWFKESGLTNQVTASTTVTATSNHTLYAKWAANTYTVKFNANGGTGSMSNLTCTVGSNCTLTTNEFAKSNSTFVMWSTNSGTVAILNNTSTFSGECTSGEYKDFKEFTKIVKPSKNQKFGLDCDVKGNGRMENYLYGSNNTSYLQVASYTTSQGKSGTSKDGHNVIDTTDSYKHYHVDFTMGSSPESYENKNLLFRVKNGYSGSVKNIKFYRKVGSENIYVDGAKVKDIASGGSSITLYAIWIASGGSTGGWRLRCTYEIGGNNDPITQYYGSEADCNAAKAGFGGTWACTCSKV